MELNRPHKTDLTPERVITFTNWDYDYWDCKCKYFFGNVRGVWIFNKLNEKIKPFWKGMLKLTHGNNVVTRFLNVRAVEFISNNNGNLITEIYIRNKKVSWKQWSRFKHNF